MIKIKNDLAFNFLSTNSNSIINMKKILCFAAIIVWSVQFHIQAQNYLWLNNGKKMQIGNYKIENPEIISYTNLKGKTRTIQSYDVFSINEESGKEVLIYTPDTSYEGAFTVPEMRSFVLGQYDAGQNYKSPWITVGGIAVAVASPAIVKPLYIILISTGYCAGVGLTNPKEKKLKISPEFLNNEHYKSGYKKEVKNKRIKNAIIGSCIGLVVGISTYSVIYAK